MQRRTIGGSFEKSNGTIYTGDIRTGIVKAIQTCTVHSINSRVIVQQYGDIGAANRTRGIDYGMITRTVLTNKLNSFVNVGTSCIFANDNRVQQSVGYLAKLRLFWSIVRSILVY